MYLHMYVCMYVYMCTYACKDMSICMHVKHTKEYPRPSQKSSSVLYEFLSPPQNPIAYASTSQTYAQTLDTY